MAAGGVAVRRWDAVPRITRVGKVYAAGGQTIRVESQGLNSTAALL